MSDDDDPLRRHARTNAARSLREQRRDEIEAREARRMDALVAPLVWHEAEQEALVAREIEERNGVVRAAPPDPAAEADRILRSLDLLRGSFFASVAYASARGLGASNRDAMVWAAFGGLTESALHLAAPVAGAVVAARRRSSVPRRPPPFVEPVGPALRLPPVAPRGAIRPAGRRRIFNALTQHGDRITLDLDGRILQVTGVLRPSQLGTGSRPDVAGQQAARAASGASGFRMDAAHLRARGLGGSGEFTMPLYLGVNRGRMQALERRLARLLARLGPSDRLEFSVSAHWNASVPEGVFYRIRLNGTTVCRAWFPNDGNNVVQHMEHGPGGAVVHVERGR